MFTNRQAQLGKGCTYAGFVCQKPAKADRIEERAGTQDLRGRQVRELLRQRGHEIDGVGNDKEDGVGPERFHLVDD